MSSPYSPDNAKPDEWAAKGTKFVGVKAMVENEAWLQHCTHNYGLVIASQLHSSLNIILSGGKYKHIQQI